MPSFTNTPSQINTSLRGPDVIVNTIPVTTYAGHGMPVHGAILVNDSTIEVNGNFQITFDTTSDYYFMNTISEEVLHRYLDRAIQATELSMMWWDNGPGAPGPSYGPDYDPYSNVAPLYDAAYDHGKLLRMILNTGTKFVFDNAFFTPPNPNWDSLSWICQTIKNDNDFLHTNDPEIICGASIEEVIPAQDTMVLLPPPAVIDLFWQARPSSADQAYFDYKLMQIDYAYVLAHNNNQYLHEGHLDLTKPETQMWYYYLATRYIDAGCESIHFGDLFDGCWNDNGNGSLWYLVYQIRRYAATHARRGLVLLDTHAGYVPADLHQSHVLYGWYFDPYPSNPVPDWQRQLIFDFHSLGIYYPRNTGKPCIDPSSLASYGSSILPVLLEYGDGLLNHSRCGMNPQGWLCSHNPVLCRLDSGGIYPNAGCSYPISSDPVSPDLYGYDNTSWFGRQYTSEKAAILKYTYYRIKCLDPYSHFCMPCRLIVRNNLPVASYQFYYNALTEETTITAIWSGTYKGPDDWAAHNFTEENGADQDMHPDVPPKLSLVFAGPDKIYFIAQDGYIHGYIYNNGTYNDGNWLTASPSYSANIPAGSQVKAASDLVASPDGTRLLYIGVDGYIHGFDIVNAWAYNYFDFLKSDMIRQNIKAVGSLIYPTNDSAYYIGASPGGKRLIFGFQNASSPGIWLTVSPSYSADGSGVVDERIANQAEAAGALTYGGAYRRLYYRTTGGYLAYFDIINLVVYRYGNSDVNYQLQAQAVKIVGNLAVHDNRLYYVGLYAGSYNIYCIIDNGGSSATVSPSWSADIYNGQPINAQIQSDPTGQIAVSPDGNTIAYFGKLPDLYLCYYTNIDGVDFSFNRNENAIITVGDNSLQFISNTDMYYICRDGTVRYFKYQEAYCNNPTITAYE